MPSRLFPAFAWLSLVALGACSGEPLLCGTRVDPVRRIDGGVFECVKAEDCPRPSNVLVCVTDTSSGRDCVACVAAQCVRKVPEGCP